MTTYESVYRAGQIVAAVEKTCSQPLTVACVNNCSTLPSRIHILLRHVWNKTSTIPVVAELLTDWIPKQPAHGGELGGFWLGYYHWKHQNAK